MTLALFSRETFEYFFEKIYGEKAYGFTRSLRSESMYKSFAERLKNQYKESAGPEFIWFYCLYQFGRYEIVNFTPQNPYRKVAPASIFGPLAIKKYEERNQKMDFAIKQSSYLQRFQISQQDFVNKTRVTFNPSMEMLTTAQVVDMLSDYIDPIKEVASRTEHGLDLCLDTNDLFNPRDPSCGKCKFSDQCKIEQKKLYPYIYKQRTYGSREGRSVVERLCV